MKVIHDKKSKKFKVALDSYEAVLMYARKGDVLDFYHIYVPDPYRKRGLAAKILIEAFEYAGKEGFRVVPSCPFIAGEFLPRFSKYQNLAAEGCFPFADREVRKGRYHAGRAGS